MRIMNTGFCAHIANGVEIYKCCLNREKNQPLLHFCRDSSKKKIDLILWAARKRGANFQN